MKTVRNITTFSLLLALSVLSLSGSATGKDPKITPEELIENHLASIGSAEARTAVRNRASSGRFTWEVVVNGTGRFIGETTCLSEGTNFRMKGVFNRPQYTGEDMIHYDGETTVAKGRPDRRSLLGEFVLTEKKGLLHEGLFGGALNVGWALAHTDGNQPRLKYDGLKKIGGREYHVLKYSPRKGSSSLKTKMYFEQESFRHVMTVYETVLPEGVKAGIAGNVMSTSKFRTTVTETFGDFIQLDNLTLPSIWKIRVQLRIDTDSVVQEWTSNYNRMAHNIELGTEQFKSD